MIELNFDFWLAMIFLAVAVLFLSIISFRFLRKEGIGFKVVGLGTFCIALALLLNIIFYALDLFPEVYWMFVEVFHILGAILIVTGILNSKISGEKSVKVSDRDKEIKKHMVVKEKSKLLGNFKMRLSTMLIIYFITTAIIGTGGGAYLLYNSSANLIREQIVNNLESTAQSRADHIETYLEQNVERLKLITSKTQLKIELDEYNENKNQESFEKMRKILDDSKESIEEIERICIVGLDGKVIISTDDSFYGKDIFEKDFFQKGLNKEVIHFIEEDDELKIFVSGPFISEGKLSGVGVMIGEMGTLEKIVEDRTGLGETGEVLIAIDGEENERVYFFERLFESEALEQAEESEETALSMKAALSGEETFFEEVLDYRDQSVLAMSQYIETGEIGLVAKIDFDETVGEVQNNLIRVSFVLGFFIVFFVSILGYFVGRLVNKPIMGLTENVEKITRGKFDVELRKSRIKEIQGLIDSLNRVLASLKLAILRTGRADVGDITKEFSKKLESEGKYRRLYEESKNAIMILDPEKMKFVDGNPAALKLFGVSSVETFSKLSPSDLSPKIQADGKSSLEKAREMVDIALKEGLNRFPWTHKKLKGDEFETEITLRKLELGGRSIIQVTVDIMKKEKGGLKPLTKK